ncbi:MAG: WD40 repeat domain-containing protein [Kofleriaceae bacterium]
MAVGVGAAMLVVSGIALAFAVRAIVAERDRATRSERDVIRAHDQLLLDAARTALTTDPRSAIASLHRIPLEADAAIQREAWLVAVAASPAMIATAAYTAPGDSYVAAYFTASGDIVAMSYRPDGGPAGDKPARLAVDRWRAGTVTRLAVVPNARFQITVDRRFVVWLDEDRAVHAWNVDEDREIALPQHAAAFVLAAGSELDLLGPDGCVERLDLRTRQTGPCPVQRASARYDAGEITTIDARGATHRARVPVTTTRPPRIHYAPDGSAFVMSFGDEVVSSDIALAHPQYAKTDVIDLRYSADASTLAIVGSHGVYGWKPALGTGTHSYTGGLDERDAAIAASATQVVTTNGTDLIVWDLAIGNEIRIPRAHAGFVTHVDLSLDGTRALSTATDGTLRVWATGPQVPTLYERTGAWSLAVSPDGRTARYAVGPNGYLQGVQLWSPPNTPVTVTVEREPAPSTVVAGPRDFRAPSAVSGDGTRAAFAFERSLVTVEVATGAQHRRALAELPDALAFSDDGARLLATGAMVRVFPDDRELGRHACGAFWLHDGSVLVVEAREVRRVDPAYVAHVVMAIAGECTASALAADQRALAIGFADGRTQLIELATATRGDLPSGPQATTAIAFGSHGEIAIAHGPAITVWSAGGTRRQLAGPNRDVIALRWSLDGTLLQGWTRDGSWLWDPEIEKGTELDGRDVVLGATTMFQIHRSTFSTTIRAFELPPREPHALRGWLERQTSYRLR